MALLGLFILIASVSFLCYRHPPSSWSFLQWLRRPAIHDTEKKYLHDAPETPTIEEPQAEPKEEALSIDKDRAPVVAQKELDRKAMPPPPPRVLKKPITKAPSPPRVPRASTLSASNPIPSFSLGDSDMDTDDYPIAPSFPAANSAQRASGGTRGPPRLNAVPAPSGAGLMAPPSRSPLPNRSPNASLSSSLAPPPTHNAPPTKPRKKVLLTPGHSPLDWARLTSSSANLTGLPPGTPFLRVPPSLLKQYTGRKGKDAWTVLGGKVYNMTPYLPYHPGGEPELMKAAGRDGTRLFGEVHPWVNWEGMLEGCLIGIAVEEGEKNQLEEMD